MLKTFDKTKVLDLAQKAESTGTYEEGLKLLQPDYWDYLKPEDKPKTDNLTEQESAEIYLACGILYGFYGTRQQNAQEISKDLITKALVVFGELDLKERQLRCWNYLAVSYWRTGEFDEALAMLAHSFSLGFPDDHHGVLRALIVECMVNVQQKQRRILVLQRLEFWRHHFEACNDDYLMAMFYNLLGIAKKNLGKFSDALAAQVLSRDLYQKLGNIRYLSYAENNLANYYRKTGDFDNALRCANRALLIAKKLGDVRQIGGIYDTKALIAFDAEDYITALEFATIAVHELKKTESYNYLIEYSETKIRVLLKLNRYNEAFLVYAEAMNNAGRYVPEKVRLQLTNTLTKAVKDKKNAKNTVKREKEKEVQNNEPESDYFDVDYQPIVSTQCIRINTDDYTHLGLERGAVAVVERLAPQSGDFIAFRDKKTNSVYFGYADFIEEMVMVDLRNGKETQIFTIDKIHVIGKVVRYGTPDKCGYIRTQYFC